MKRLLTYGLMLLTLLASLFVVSACQEDEIPHDTTEVMMTFTTRAVVTQDKESDVIDVEKMDNLRVIMVREDGTIAYKEENVINGSRVTVIFNTPVKTGGENFQFFAIANEDDILPTQNLGNIQSGDIEALKNRIVGNGSEFTINNAIPQTKYWTAKVNPYESLSVSQQLDYLVSKISVQFKNETNKAQSLSNIHITGITPNGKGCLFNHPTGEKDDKGEEIYEEVYVTENSDVTLNEGKINFETITVDAATNKEGVITPTPSAIKHYYTYPVDNGNISSPTLHATWNGKNYTLPLEGITELKRNDHLKIIVTLTGQELVVNYSIAPWVEEPTNIGSPTTGGGYNTEDWTAGGDVNIGGDPVEPDVPDTPVGEGEVPVWGDKVGEGSQEINWSEEGKNLVVELSWLENAATITGPDGKEGILMYAYITGTGNMQIRKVGDSTNTQYDGLYLNNSKTGWIGGLSSEKISVFIPNDVVDTQFYFSGENYTIKKVTVVK